MCPFPHIVAILCALLCNIRTRARLGHVTSLGGPRSVYKSDIECRFLSQNGQMTLKVKVNDSHFEYQLRVSQEAYLVQICWFQLKSIISYHMDRPQDGQNDFEGQDQWPPFSIPAMSILGCIIDANLVILAQICDELSCWQAKFPRILSQIGPNDLEGHGQWPLLSIPT